MSDGQSSSTQEGENKKSKGGLILGIPRERLTTENLKNIVTSAAIIGLGLYFGYKSFLGWGWLSVELEVTTERAPNPQDMDFDIVVIKLDITSGSSGSFKIRDAVAQVRYGAELKAVRFTGMTRLDWNENDRLVVDTRNLADPYAGFAPNQRLVFATTVCVPHTEVCVIDVAILCRRPYHYMRSQILSSTVSLPIRASVVEGENVLSVRETAPASETTKTLQP